VAVGPQQGISRRRRRDGHRAVRRGRLSRLDRDPGLGRGAGRRSGAGYRDHPADLGVSAYGAPPDAPPVPRLAPAPQNPAGVAARALRDLFRTPAFWALTLGFAICGASTNGLVATHFVPAAHDHGMPTTTAAGLLAIVGVFDVVGTVNSGWLTDRVDPRLLLGAYYTLRGVSLALLPMLPQGSMQPSIVVFVVFYGLDWVATVPPTVALCHDVLGEGGTVVFGWVFASHPLGAALATTAAGVVRDVTGTYTAAWLGTGALCLVAAVLSLRVARHAEPRPPLMTTRPMS
jgi:predicted MFS family arabinose efflux permease